MSSSQLPNSFVLCWWVTSSWLFHLEWAWSHEADLSIPAHLIHRFCQGILLKALKNFLWALQPSQSYCLYLFWKFLAFHWHEAPNFDPESHFLCFGLQFGDQPLKSMNMEWMVAMDFEMVNLELEPLRRVEMGISLSLAFILIPWYFDFGQPEFLFLLIWELHFDFGLLIMQLQ